MEMSLFLYGNSAEMRETKGKSCTFLFMLAYLETEHGRHKKYLGGILFHGLEYLIRNEVVFCFIF